ALMGAAVVPATFQVTVVKFENTPPLLCDVITNGPAPPTTLTDISEVFTPPPPARLSRAVTRKFSVRDVVGMTSPIVSVLFNKFCRRGKIRVGLAVGLKERNSGLLPLSGVVTVVAAPRSCSSQQ